MVPNSLFAWESLFVPIGKINTVTTDDLQLEGFLPWTAFNRTGKPELLRKVPSQFGVDVVRATKAVERRIRARHDQ